MWYKSFLRAVALVLVVTIVLCLAGCGGNSLNGKYVSESGTYTVEFKSDGSCTWYQGGAFFNGTYQQVDGGWQLNIVGGGRYSNTVFYAEGNGRTLVITGGVVNGETFNKQ